MMQAFQRHISGNRQIFAPKDAKGFVIALLLALAAVATANAQFTRNQVPSDLYSYYLRAYANLDKPKVLLMADTLAAMAKRQNNNTAALCLARQLKVNHYYETDQQEPLFREVRAGMKFARKTPCQSFIFSYWNRIILFQLRHRKLFEAYLEAQEYEKEAVRLNNEYGIIYSPLNNGDVYSRIGDYSSALENYLKFENAKKRDVYIVYSRIGNVYLQLGDYEKCVYYCEKSLSASASASTTQRKHTSSEAPLLHLLTAYIALNDKQKAQSTYKRLLDLRSKHKFSKVNDIHFWICSGSYFNLIGDYQSTRLCLDSIHDTSHQSDIIRCDYYEHTGDYKKAYESLIRADESRDADIIRTTNLIQDIFSAHFHTKELEITKNGLSLQNSELRMKEIENQHRRIINEKRLTDIRLAQQKTSMQHLKEKAERQHIEIMEKEEELKIAQEEDSQKSNISLAVQLGTAAVFLLFLIYILTLIHHSKTLKRKSEEAKEAKEQAQNADCLKTSFLQNISHEIRTPLNAVVGFNDLLNDKDADLEPEERNEMLSEIHNNSELLLKLMDEIMEMSRLETADYELEYHTFRAYDLCSNILTSLKNEVPDGIELLFETENPDLILNTDDELLCMVLMRLIRNAFKYTAKGKVSLSYRIENGRITFSVSDTGTGIPAEKADEIFIQFQKLDSFSKGFGLGLSICKKIAKILEGDIRLDTGYQHGARFLVTLPIHPLQN